MQVRPVSLLGVRVTAHAFLNRAEHERRSALSLGAITDPALLDGLLGMSVRQPICDPVLWAETSALPDGVVDRGDDGRTVTRLLETPLVVNDVIVQVMRGRELQAVQEASLFAAFTRRWVATGHSETQDAVVMEAKLCGVGLLGPASSVLLQAEPPSAEVPDGWAWLLQEKTYRRWLRGPRQAHAMGNQAPATGEASAAATG
jgi:hypothetical protein